MRCYDRRRQALRRPLEPGLYAGYFPLVADDLARQRRQRRRKLCRNDSLGRHVVEKLAAGWSPQQIAGRLPLDAPAGVSVCHETIYRYVHGPASSGSTGTCPRRAADGRRATAASRAPRSSQPSAPSSSGRARSPSAGPSATGKPIGGSSGASTARPT
jgi:transposase, IS30 family